MKDLKNLEPGDYVRILWKRRWYLIVTAVLIIAGAVIFSRIMPDVFRSETRIMVVQPLIGGESGRVSRLDVEDRINSIREQLASRTFLERMIEQFQMYGYGARREFVMEAAVKLAQQQIGIKKTSNNTFTVSFIAGDPQFAQMVTRQLAQELIRISSSSRKDKVVATDQFIDEQLRQSTEALAAQEEKIKRFKTAHLGELPEQNNANMNALTGLHAQLTAAENAIQQALQNQKLLDFKWQERKRLNLLSQSVAAAENAVKAPEQKEKGPDLAEAELSAKRSVLEQYKAKYTSSHPDVVTLTRDIERLEQQVREKSRGTEPPDSVASEPETKGKSAPKPDPLEAAFEFEAESIKAEIAKREKEKQEILGQIKIYQSRLNLAPVLEQELVTLMREQDVLKTRYETLQKQKFTTQMASTAETDTKNETYRIIDEANLPVKAQFPNRLQMVLLGIGGGLVMGVGAAFGRELLDNTISSEEEAKRVLDLPVLVAIPTVPKQKKAKTA